MRTFSNLLLSGLGIGAAAETGDDLFIYFGRVTFFSFQEESQSLKEAEELHLCVQNLQSPNQTDKFQPVHSETGVLQASLTSSYVDVGGVENIIAATLRWYHGSSAKAKHLRHRFS